jgi:hypothetical protein
MLGSKLPSPSVLHTGIGRILRHTYPLVRYTIRFNSRTFVSPPQMAQRMFPTHFFPTHSNARFSGRSLSTQRLLDILVLALLLALLPLKRGFIVWVVYGANTERFAATLETMPEAVISSSIVGVCSTGHRLGFNSVMKELLRDKDRVRKV